MMALNDSLTCIAICQVMKGRFAAYCEMQQGQSTALPGQKAVRDESGSWLMPWQHSEPVDESLLGLWKWHEESCRDSWNDMVESLGGVSTFQGGMEVK